MRMNIEVLVVDDSDEEASLTLAALRSAAPNATMMRLTDGDEALHFIRSTDGYSSRAEWPPRLVLIELYLPGMGGISVLHNLRARPDMQALPVVVWTSKSNPWCIELALEAGASAYHVKPTALVGYRAEINSIVQRWLRRGAIASDGTSAAGLSQPANSSTDSGTVVARGARDTSAARPER